ncbi:MAG: gliding motility-associated C-terminal domain-containing protein [Sphingobacteriaceae bacterium]|nr:gliding motility-associated C-terminal domain-containing protein [Sphingobacteriaceae bacterium]
MNKVLFIFILLSYSFYGLAQICGTPGLDGSGNISGSINTYFPVSGNITLSSGTKQVQLSSVPPNDNYGNNFGTKPISAGDMLLIIQMQDATINFSDNNLYGANNSSYGPDNLGGTGFTALGNTGTFEYVIATNAVGLGGGNLTFRGAGVNKGTVHTYFAADETSVRGKRTFQVVRIPQYSNLVLSSSINTPPFNGHAGGIIAFDVSGSMNFSGFTIDASSRGFRGGYGSSSLSKGNISSIYVTPSSDLRSVGKGEGIAGTPRFMWDGYNDPDNLTEGLPGGSSGKGAPGNAGGGGHDHNAGGGGGGNGGFGGVGGNGTASVPDAPNTFPNGGRPGSISYTGASLDISRIIMGGGGGGGDANNALSGVKGGVGGGIILINVGQIVGTGVIRANGGDGAAGIQGSQPDGAGGGGAGGTVYIKVSDPIPGGVLTVEAKGGNGGNTRGDIGTNEHGPGGGGGGGEIFYAMSSGTINRDVSAGNAGRANSGAGTSHGAENGKIGISLPFLISSLPPYLQGGGSACYPVLSTTVDVVNPSVIRVPGMEVEYIIKAVNQPGGGNAGGARIEALLPPGISYKSATVEYHNDSGGPALITNLPPGNAQRPLFGDFNIAPGGDVTITVKATIDCGVAPQIFNTSAQTLHFDPTRTIGDPDRRITSKINAFPGSNIQYEGSLGFVPGSNFSGASSSSDNVAVANAGPLTNNTITIPTNADKFCVNTSGDFVDPVRITGSNPTGDIGIYTFQWQSSTDNVNFTNIAGAISKDYDPPPINTSTYYKRIVTSSPCTLPVESLGVKVLLAIVPVADFELPGFCLSDGSATFTNTTTIADGTDSQLTYEWNFGEPSSAGLNTSIIKNGTHAYSAPGVYTVTLKSTSKDGCVNTKTHFFTVNGSNPNADFQVRNLTALCSGIPVKFEDKASVNFGEITKIEWYYDYLNNPAQVEIDNTPGLRTAPKVYSYLYPASTTAMKVYRVRMKVYSGATCVDDSFIDISVYSKPEVVFNTIAPVCLKNTPFQIIQASETVGVGGSGVFTGNGVSSSGMFNPASAGVGTHTITYTFTSASGGCSDAKSQDIIVQPNPVVLNDDVDILLGGEITLPAIAEQSGLDYQWSPATALSGTTILTPIASPEQTTVYTLRATDKNTGCSSEGTVTVTVNKTPEVPNTFTPNGDGINDLWVIANLNTYTNCVIKVFNRSGQMVFSTTGYSTPWDGTFKGNPLPAATYYYTIDPQKGRKVIAGSITILR